MKKSLRILLSVICLAAVVGVPFLVKGRNQHGVQMPKPAGEKCAVEVGGYNTSLTYDPDDAQLNVTQQAWEYHFSNTGTSIK